MDLNKQIQAAELELLGSSTRNNSGRVRELLHPEFIEIGRSGRRWTRAEIISALSTEQHRPTPDTDDWEFFRLAPELILATYRLRTPAAPAAVPGSPVESGSVSRHSSVWDVSAPQARLRFHQGTVILPNS